MLMTLLDLLFVATRAIGLAISVYFVRNYFVNLWNQYVYTNPKEY